MDARPIIGEHEVVFQPKGVLESLDYTNAINALNSGTELALGVLGKDGEVRMSEAAFVVSKMDQDKKLYINVLDTLNGRQLEEAIGVLPLRFAASVEMDVVEGQHVPTKFSHFFAVVETD